MPPTFAMIDITVASCSEPGARDSNEDDLRSGHAGATWYAVLADGAGGHKRGAEASRRAVERVAALLQDSPPPWPPEAMTEALMAAHAEVRRGQDGAKGSDRMLTTVVALWIDAVRQRALWSHVGDSRLYRLRHGIVDFVTSDDSVVQRLYDAGLLSASQAQGHPYKNQLVAALGMDDELDPHTVPQPVEVEDGDAFLLCSDGWWGSLEETEIIDTLNNADTPEHWLHLMRECIEARGVPNQDNFSAIALWAGDPWESTRGVDL